METPLVSIACITYNQAKFVRQCLDGFIMQKTTFPVEIVIHDDASTDGTQDIIREYIEKYPTLHWKPILQTENKYKEGNGILVPYVFPECTGKYIALCEGDDYWTDPMKLQMEVEYLESHLECNIVYTNIDRYFQERGVLEHSFFKTGGDRNYSHDDCIVRGPFVAPCTWMFRRDLIQSIPKLDSASYFTGDVLYLLHFTENGSIHYLDSVTSVYRVLEQSASHFAKEKDLLSFARKNKHTRQFYAAKRPFFVSFKLHVYMAYYSFRIVKKNISLWSLWISFIIQDISLSFQLRKEIR